MKKLNKSSLSMALMVVVLGLVIFGSFKITANAIIKLNGKVNKLESHIDIENDSDVINGSAIKNNNLSFLCPYCNDELSLNYSSSIAYFSCRSCQYNSPVISKHSTDDNDEDHIDILKQCFISGDWSIIK